ncbi:hypothetical protein BGZ60DRAFT_425402 [Tricladium varicosporioides]|nr:hypothetical protein BGZ60DRAFT_425402 [Hymenoscyphus varicosporioides]
MVNLTNRMRKLTEIRCGSGAAILPPEVTRIHLRFSREGRDSGHMGIQSFWKQDLRQLKYHNPAVAMTVDRSLKQDDTAYMFIHFAKSDAVATSNTPVSSTSTKLTSTTALKSELGALTERVEQVKVKNIGRPAITEQLFKLTNAIKIETSPEDKQRIQELRDQEKKSKKDRALIQIVKRNNKLAKEKELLKLGGMAS